MTSNCHDSTTLLIRKPFQITPFYQLQSSKIYILHLSIKHWIKKTAITLQLKLQPLKSKAGETAQRKKLQLKQKARNLNGKRVLVSLSLSVSLSLCVDSAAQERL
jgi:hypothetical protein